jgi:hypothetical protein
MSATPNPIPFPASERGGASLRDRVMDLQLLADTVEALDADDLSPELRDDLTEDITAAIAGTREKVDRTGDVLGYFEAAQAAATREIERLTKRREHFERAQARLERYVLSVLETSKFVKLEGHTTTLSARQNPPSLVIAEGTVLPERFLRYAPAPPPVPDKSAIKTSLKHGAVIDGCTLQATTRLVRS